MPIPDLITVSEAAEKLRTTPRVVRERISRGEILPVAKIGKSLLIYPEALEGYIESKTIHSTEDRTQTAKSYYGYGRRRKPKGPPPKL